MVTATIGVALTAFTLEAKGLWLLAAGGTVLLNRQHIGLQLANRPSNRIRRVFVPFPERRPHVPTTA
jgi:hypothetical protein